MPPHNENNRTMPFFPAASREPHPFGAQGDARGKLPDWLQVTLDSLTDGFALVDPAWRITYGNPAACRMLGVSNEILGHLLWDVFPAIRGSVFEANYRRAMDRREVCRFDAHYEPLGLWVRACAFPSGHGLGISFSDITAAMNARRQLLHSNEQLEERVRERTEQLKRINEELSAFTLAVAHDLRAPLAGISGFSRAIAERLEGHPDAKVAHYLSRVQAGVERMDDLLEGLLALSRIGSAEIAPQPQDLSAIARETIECLRTAAPGRPVLVRIEDGLRAHGDARLLRTLVENLLGNAWKFTAARDPAHIEMGRDTEGAYFVRDNGAGFDMQHARELFTPFRRLHDAQAFGGLGIGLASARRVVERHGGRIWAEAAPGAGAVFRFTLGAGPAQP